MSDIPQARTLIEEVLLTDLTPEQRRKLRKALALMKREEYVRRASAKPRRIDKFMRSRIRVLADKNPDMTMHEIANEVGLRSSGRISEVMHGKR